MNNPIYNISGDIHDIEYIFSPKTIRKKSLEIFNLTLDGKTNFTLDLKKLEDVSKYVCSVTLENYPNLNIPFHSRWNHFQVGNIDRISELNKKLEKVSPTLRNKAKLDLVVVSVLLDAGAGMRWSYEEKETGKNFQRSEGLAVATLRMFLNGFFSNDEKNPFQVNSQRLKTISFEELAIAFQSNDKNELIGLEGRLKLLQNLGKALESERILFGQENPRIGNIIEYLNDKCPSGLLASEVILRTIQEGLGTIWPGRVSIQQKNMGDTWIYPKLGEGIDCLVPFHKLSQWLSYSLFEPLSESGFSISSIDSLTGLAEYRNGGLMIDTGLIELKDQSLSKLQHPPSSELIIEWRALTISLLDEIGKKVTELLGKNTSDFPLAKVLEGGTWWAGRNIAHKLRKDGSPPIKLESDGTVF